ncbi:MAG: hypothetical protein Q7R62_02050 [bacterium]|nr:hypothetical protein [bacterium]
MRYFIASRWENMKQVQILTENISALGNEVFSFVKDPRNFVSKEELKTLPTALKDLKNWRTNEQLRGLYERELEGLRESDVFILLLPGGESSHIQAGIAFGLGKKTVLIGQPEAVKTHYLIFDEYFSSIDDYLLSLKKL